MDDTPDNLDNHTPEEIAQGAQDYFRYLEECDSREVDYTWEAISAHDWGQPPMPPQDWAHAMTNWAKSMGYVGPEPG